MRIKIRNTTIAIFVFSLVIYGGDGATIAIILATAAVVLLSVSIKSIKNTFLRGKE